MNNARIQSGLELLNTDHVWLDERWHYRNVTSTFYRMYFIPAGSGELIQSTRKTTLQPNHLYLIPSYTTCTYICREHLEQYYISFIEESADGKGLFADNRTVFSLPAVAGDRERFERVLALNPLRGLFHSHDPEDYEKRKILNGFREHNREMPLWALMETESILIYLVSRFVASPDFQLSRIGSIDSRILDAINYIATHLSENLTVADLARRANQHPDHFSRSFHANTGERPLTYIQHKRIESAQLLLHTSDVTLVEVAESTGFENVSYFSRIFKKITGQTPGDFRNRTRQF